jgi:S-(hydroxymethyl)glutathione dehydrogenase / alcohol dehydrogenase
MKINAAVLRTPGSPLTIEPLELDAPEAGEVLVEVKAAGVCHSDLHPALGDWPVPTPVVLGHEGAGVVRAVGQGVTSVASGDVVVFCWAPPCGACPSCQSGHPVLCDRLDRTAYRHRLPSGSARLRAGDDRVAAFLGTACFADFAVVAEAGAVRVPAGVPFDVLATLGCAVVTGVGAVMNAAQVEPGSTVVVIGAGGVGLNVVQGAALSCSGRIVAIDRQEAPLRLARAFGATDVALAPPSIVDAVRELTGGRGADYVFDTVGSPSTVADAVAAARKGGTIVVTGLARIDGVASIATFPFVMQEKRLIGSVYGSGRPSHDIPKLAELYREGKLKLRELVTRTYPLGEINEAFAALARADGARGVISW